MKITPIGVFAKSCFKSIFDKVIHPFKKTTMTQRNLLFIVLLLTSFTMAVMAVLTPVILFYQHLLPAAGVQH